MRFARITSVLALTVASALLAGCGSDGTKSLFTNQLDRPVPTEFVTQGVGRVDMGKIAPGKTKTTRVTFDEELLEGTLLSVTIYGGTVDTMSRQFIVGDTAPKRIHVYIKPDPDLVFTIEAHDKQGYKLESR